MSSRGGRAGERGKETRGSRFVDEIFIEEFRSGRRLTEGWYRGHPREGRKFGDHGGWGGKKEPNQLEERKDTSLPSSRFSFLRSFFLTTSSSVSLSPLRFTLSSP